MRATGTQKLGDQSCPTITRSGAEGKEEEEEKAWTIPERFYTVRFPNGSVTRKFWGLV